MKTSLRLIIITILSLSTVQLSGQYIEKKLCNNYTYMDKTYKFQDMETIMYDNLTAHLSYKEAMRLRTNARVAGYITFGSLRIGTLAAIIDNSEPPYCDLYCLNTGGNLALFAWILVLPIVGTLGIISRVKYNLHKKKTVSIFNNSTFISHIAEPPSWNIQLGGNHGLGLVVNF